MSIADGALAAYKKCSLITKLIGGIILVFYALSFFKESKKLLAMTPGYFMPPNYYVWTLLSFVFFDDHWYCVLIDIVTLFFSNTLLEPLWGQRELMKYLLIVTVMSGLMCFFLCYFLYLFTYSTIFIFNTHIHGMIAYAAAITVAVRQTLPDDIILSLPIANVKNQHLSFICMLIVICMSFLNLVSYVYSFLFLSGILVSWTYLRFYQRHENGRLGDHSDSFEFARFFPNHLVPPVSIVGNALFALLVRLRICRKFERQVSAAPLSGVITSSMASRDPDETERRKQLALKALNDRLHSAGHEATPWPKEAAGPGSAGPTLAATTAAAAPPVDADADADVIVSTASSAAGSEPPPPPPPQHQQQAAQGGQPTATSSPAVHKTLTSSELRQLPVPDFRPQFAAGGKPSPPSAAGKSSEGGASGP